MNPPSIGLIDTSFRHHPLNTVPGNTSEFIEWNRDNPFSENLVCFTNEKIIDESAFRIAKERRIAILYESLDTMRWLYESTETYIPEYSIFFTHDKTLLDQYPNTRWIPGNGIWVGNSYGGGELSISSKDRMTSFITSLKETTALQRLRVRLAEKLQVKSDYEIDVFLRSTYAYDYLPISQCLQRYRFSLIIENTQSPLYFTEKLLNCFATGTIPIYLGATEIDKFFDINGIIVFSSRKQLLNDILPRLSVDLYSSKMESIETNFKLCQSYKSIEKIVSSHLEDLLH